MRSVQDQFLLGRYLLTNWCLWRSCLTTPWCSVVLSRCERFCFWMRRTSRMLCATACIGDVLSGNIDLLERIDEAIGITHKGLSNAQLRCQLGIACRENLGSLHFRAFMAHKGNDGIADSSQARRSLGTQDHIHVVAASLLRELFNQFREVFFNLLIHKQSIELIDDQQDRNIH